MISAEDKLAIHELIALYGHIIDERQYSRVDELFTADSIYDVSAIDGKVYSGAAAIGGLGRRPCDLPQSILSIASSAAVAAWSTCLSCSSGTTFLA